jgi:hypothetical protein
MPRVSLSRALFATVIVLLVACSTAPVVTPQESIAVAESERTFDITVPVSKIELCLQKTNFMRASPPMASGSALSSRHFIFKDQGRSIFLSGWFESARLFPGVKEPSAGTFQGEKLQHSNVSIEKIGDWDVVLYDVIFRANSTANLEAHLVRSGTWVELHLSGTSGHPISEQRTLLTEAIRSIQIREKL